MTESTTHGALRGRGRLGPVSLMLSLLCLGLFSATTPAQDQTPTPARPSPWYLERGTHLRSAGPEDDVPRVLATLVELMRDNQVPGFYDGQFSELSADFTELARLAKDESVDHTLRLMAVMALQEAADGERLRVELAPLLMSVDEEFSEELRDWGDNGNTVDEDYVRRVLRADLSRHVRFALAKDGQPEAVRAKIRVMEAYVWRDRATILDPAIKSERDQRVAHKRSIWFDIGYHYQQFDDYPSAARWFGMLCDNLTGDETRWAHYNLACMASIQGDNPLALSELQAAFEAGFLDVNWMLEDGDLVPLRALPEFVELARQMGASEGEIAPNQDSTQAPADPEAP